MSTSVAVTSRIGVPSAQVSKIVLKYVDVWNRGGLVPHVTVIETWEVDLRSGHCES